MRPDNGLREIPVYSMNDLYDLVYNPFVKEDGTTVSLEKAISDDLKRWDKSCVEHGYSFRKTEDPSHIIW